MNLSEILDAIDGQIRLLQQARKLLSNSESAPATGTPTQAKRAGKKKLSEEGRARIAAGQKRRWAERQKLAA